MKPPVSLDKQYKTRDGREVRIHAIDGPDPLEPVVASVKNPDGWMAVTWPADGVTMALDANLIEVVPLWEGEVWVDRAGRIRELCHFVSCEAEGINREGWRKIKVKQVEEPT